jgi:hypothetical protein
VTGECVMLTSSSYVPCQDEEHDELLSPGIPGEL